MPKRYEPATSAVAPASTHMRAVAAFTPPSTETSREGLFLLAQEATADIFARLSGMKDCPPNPGCTDITSARSHLGSHSVIISTGVSGLMETPLSSPLASMASSARPTSPQDSACTVIMSHPASAKAST